LIMHCAVATPIDPSMRSTPKINFFIVLLLLVRRNVEIERNASDNACATY
jgi:hypothetical protein